MKRKTKWVFWGFLSLDYKAIQTYLEEMAAKGWMLEKVNRVMAKFIAIEPRKRHFCVDVFKKGGPFTSENTKEAEEYRALCKESGWHFITSLDYLQYFYADENDAPTPIQTDEVLEQKIVASTLWKSELFSILFFTIIGIVAIALHFPINYKNLLTYSGVFGTYVFPILFIVIFTSSLYNVSWIFRMRRAIKNGYSLDVPTLKAARRRSLAINIPVLIITGIFILAILLDALLKPQEVMNSMFAPLLGVIVGIGLRFMIKKKSKEKKDNVLYVTLAFFAIVFSMAIFSNSNVTYSDYNKIDIIPNEYPMLDTEALSEGAQLIRSGFDPGRSPVVPTHYNYWENRRIEGEEIRLVINYYSAINPGFAEIIFGGINDGIEKGIKWKDSYYLNKAMHPDEVLRVSWGVDNFSISEARDEIVIHKGSTVIHIFGELDYENVEIRDLIMNSLGI